MEIKLHNLYSSIRILEYKCEFLKKDSDRDRQELIPSMAYAYGYADVEGMPEDRNAETDVHSKS